MSSEVDVSCGWTCLFLPISICEEDQLLLLAGDKELIPILASPSGPSYH